MELSRLAIEEKEKAEVRSQLLWWCTVRRCLLFEQMELSEFRKEVEAYHKFINGQLDQFETVLQVMRGQNEKREKATHNTPPRWHQCFSVLICVSVVIRTRTCTPINSVQRLLNAFNAWRPKPRRQKKVPFHSFVYAAYDC